MIIHKAFKIGGKVVDLTPAWVGWTLAFALGWGIAFALWFFPLSRIVIDAGPKGDSNAAANFMEFCAVVVTLVMLVASGLCLYGWEESVIEGRNKRAEDALAERVKLRRQSKLTEAAEGLPPWPWDDEIEAIIKHQDEQQAMYGRGFSYMSFGRDEYPLTRIAHQWRTQSHAVPSWN